MTLELRVDEGPKGLNLYVLKADDQPTLTKWSTAFEGLLAGALGAAGVRSIFILVLLVNRTLNNLRFSSYPATSDKENPQEGSVFRSAPRWHCCEYGWIRNTRSPGTRIQIRRTGSQNWGYLPSLRKCQRYQWVQEKVWCRFVFLSRLLFRSFQNSVYLWSVLVRTVETCLSTPCVQESLSTSEGKVILMRWLVLSSFSFESYQSPSSLSICILTLWQWMVRLL